MDDENNIGVIQELNRIAFNQNFTLILASSNAECARYLETYKSYENKSSASIQEREETEFLPRLTKVLTSVRSINRTDVTTLLDVFGNFSNICNASEQQLILCPGIGEKKVKRLFQALNQPFEKKTKPRLGGDNNGYMDPPAEEPPLDISEGTLTSTTAGDEATTNK